MDDTSPLPPIPDALPALSAPGAGKPRQAVQRVTSVPTPPDLQPYVSTPTIAPDTRINWPARPVSEDVLPEHPALTLLRCPARKKWHALLNERRARKLMPPDPANPSNLVHNPEELLEAFDDYLQSLNQGVKWVTKRKGDKPESTPMHFPAYLNGFLTMLSISPMTWARWKSDGKHRRDDLVDAMYFIEGMIHTSQVHQASAGLGNTTVLTRLAQLYEKTQVSVDVEVADVSAAVQAARDLLGLATDTGRNDEVAGAGAKLVDASVVDAVDVAPEAPEEPDEPDEPDEGDSDDAARDADAPAA